MTYFTSISSPNSPKIKNKKRRGWSSLLFLTKITTFGASRILSFSLVPCKCVEPMAKQGRKNKSNRFLPFLSVSPSTNTYRFLYVTGAIKINKTHETAGHGKSGTNTHTQGRVYSHALCNFSVLLAGLSCPVALQKVEKCQGQGTVWLIREGSTSERFVIRTCVSVCGQMAALSDMIFKEEKRGEKKNPLWKSLSHHSTCSNRLILPSGWNLNP